MTYGKYSDTIELSCWENSRKRALSAVGHRDRLQWIEKERITQSC